MRRPRQPFKTQQKRYFPELSAAAVSMIPPGCVVDGEAVVWAEDRLNFNALQRRLVSGKEGLQSLVRDFPASFVGFDILCVAGQDTRNLPLRDRRSLLEELATVWSPPLSLSPMTSDRETAAKWLEEQASAGIEGLVIKWSGQLYAGGQRQWLKFKPRTTLDVVCGAVIGPIDRPQEIVAGLPLEGELRIVGRSSPLRVADSRALARWLRPAADHHPWPATVKGTTLDRFNRDRSPVALTRVEPVVVEVSADTAWSGSSFRHSLRYLRVRPELDPDEVQLPAGLPG
ncbi:ATP-dependent DNA ligase [Arthrobacter sp. ISL-30]|uniref:ATP-dependent DNA ligase n=1 Tax=Arthrobacter sp. ISL-30 TaxID=2819109 RepID=UPI001BED0B77|nr:ATP-dependent DNA ligase [Arthrobacter sp. ISL-30]MBT2512414.1 ATP-dependent DNA ligase [Arthrobacter sp. ISL-30]